MEQINNYLNNDTIDMIFDNPMPYPMRPRRLVQEFKNKNDNDKSQIIDEYVDKFINFYFNDDTSGYSVRADDEYNELFNTPTKICSAINFINEYMTEFDIPPMSDLTVEKVAYNYAYCFIIQNNQTIYGQIQLSMALFPQQ